MSEKICPYCKIRHVGPRGKTCETPECMLKHARVVSRRLSRENGREYYRRKKLRSCGIPAVIPGGGAIVSNISKLTIDKGGRTR